jgi:hypothetical protein
MFRNVLGALGIELDAPASTPAPTVPTPSAPVATATTAPVAQPAEVVKTITLTHDDAAYLAEIDNSIKVKCANLPFFAFKRSLDALSGVILDEAPRYKAAFATFNTSSSAITVDELIESSAKAILAVADEESEFNAYFDDQIAQNVTSKEAEIQSIADENQAKLAEIDRLSNKINANNEKALVLKNENQAFKSALEVKKNNFVSAKYRVEAGLKTIVGCITRYLKV